MAASYANISASYILIVEASCPSESGLFHFLKLSLRNMISTLLDCTSFPQRQLFKLVKFRGGGDNNTLFETLCLLILNTLTEVARV